MNFKITIVAILFVMVSNVSAIDTSDKKTQTGSYLEDSDLAAKPPKHRFPIMFNKYGLSKWIKVGGTWKKTNPNQSQTPSIEESRIRAKPELPPRSYNVLELLRNQDNINEDPIKEDGFVKRLAEKFSSLDAKSKWEAEVLTKNSKKSRAQTPPIEENVNRPNFELPSTSSEDLAHPPIGNVKRLIKNYSSSDVRTETPTIGDDYYNSIKPFHSSLGHLQVFELPGYENLFRPRRSFRDDSIDSAFAPPSYTYFEDYKNPEEKIFYTSTGAQSSGYNSHFNKETKPHEPSYMIEVA